MLKIYICLKISVDSGGRKALKRSHNGSRRSATFLFTTTSWRKRKRNNQKEIVRSKHKKEKWEGRRVKMERDRTGFTKKWGHRRSETWWSEAGLYLHCRIYGVLRMLCGTGAVASWPEEATSFQARVPAAPSSVLPKSARLQNTNKIHWPFPQQPLCSSESQHRKASLLSHWSLCPPADSKRSQPTWFWASERQKEVFPVMCHWSPREKLMLLTLYLCHRMYSTPFDQSGRNLSSSHFIIWLLYIL